MLLRSGQKYMINQKKITTLTKKLDLKHQCLDQIYVILAMRIVVKGNVTVSKKTFAANDFEEPNNIAAIATATNNENNNAFGEKKKSF